MKEIKLKKGYIALVDDEDYDIVNQVEWNTFPRKTTNLLYASFSKTLMHRFILRVIDPKIVVDHIDGNGLNNQKSNLRKTTHKCNIRNRNFKNKNNTHGYRGIVYFKNKKKNKWVANICYNYKRTYIGCYDTPEEAAHAFDKEAIKLFGEYCGTLNFPTDDIEKD